MDSIFISHASEDKDTFVRPLAQELSARGVDVWYDEFSLKPGDSLRRSIDKGLRDARFAIVVISEYFIGKGWTEWELNGIIQTQFSNSKQFLIPIWHQITLTAVREYSPSLADIVAIQSTDGVVSVADRICELIGPSLTHTVNKVVRKINAMTQQRCARLLKVIIQHAKAIFTCEDIELFGNLFLIDETPNGHVLECIASTQQNTLNKYFTTEREKLPLRGTIVGMSVLKGSIITINDVAPVTEYQYLNIHAGTSRLSHYTT